MIMALYLRLSKEDGDMIDESNSITNQRYILRSNAIIIPLHIPSDSLKYIFHNH